MGLKETVLSLRGLVEFTAADVSTNGKTNALYRRSSTVIDIITKNGIIQVPETLEMYMYGDWHRHPIAFPRYADPDAYARNEGEMVIFLANGAIIHLPFSTETQDRELYKQIWKYKLNEGFFKTIR